MDMDDKRGDGRDESIVAGMRGRDTRAPESARSAYEGPADTYMESTRSLTARKGLFDGISPAQVLAASAAAATSMLLASRIGIAGSVIGAAVSSMVTVVCSQLYRNALDASARKLKERQGLASPPRAGRIASGAPETRVSEGDGVPSGPHLPDADAPRARIAPAKLQARAAAERIASRRKVALVSVVLAAAAVAVSAGIILLGTSGEGLGAKTPPIFTAAPDPAPDAHAPMERPGTGDPTDRPSDSRPTVDPENQEDGGKPDQAPPDGDGGSSNGDGAKPDEGGTGPGPDDGGGALPDGGQGGSTGGDGASGPDGPQPEPGPSQSTGGRSGGATKG